jgi:hypothetical protein
LVAPFSRPLYRLLQLLRIVQPYLLSCSILFKHSLNLKSIMHGIDEKHTRYYFAYGSNMNRHQMAHRCGKDVETGINFYARVFLPKWKFLICGGGYSSIHPCDAEDLAAGNDRVWGAVYIIDKKDEEILDGYEGVAVGVYTKEVMELYVCPLGKEDIGMDKLEKISGLVYIATRHDKGIINEEYIPRMEAAVNDPDTCLPRDYVENWMRPEMDPDRHLPCHLTESIKKFVSLHQIFRSSSDL